MKIKVTQTVDIPVSPYCKKCFRIDTDQYKKRFCSLFNRYLLKRKSNLLKCEECYHALYNALYEDAEDC